MKFRKRDEVLELSRQIKRLSKSTKKVDKYKLEQLKAKRDKLVKTMEEESPFGLDKMINEVSAEIVAGKIPANRVFDVKGNVIPLDKLKGSESQSLLAAIKAVLIKTNLIKNFNPDNLSNIDIKPFKKNVYIIIPDIGAKKYLYNVATGQIREA